MTNNLLEFSKKLTEKQKNDKYTKDVLESKGDPYLYSDSKTTINFCLAYKEVYSGLGLIGNYNGPRVLITLYEEDLNYFKNKYLPKMEDEYQDNLRELQSKYGKL